MEINLNDLSVMLDEHFRLAPPLDSPNVPASGEVRQFGNGLSLGDGKTMEGVHGLENIQIMMRVGRADEVKQISMKDWLTRAIMQRPGPTILAAAVQNLLVNGQITYFEQGRELASQLRLDPETKELRAAIVAKEARPPVKPTLSRWQKVKRVFGAFNGEEADKYNRELISYEVQMKALATSAIRMPPGVGVALEHDDKKGRMYVPADQMDKALGYANARKERSQLSPADRRELEQSILSGERTYLKIASTQKEEKFFKQRYPNGKPEGITSIKEHLKAIIKKQESFICVKEMKDPKNASVLSNPNHVSRDYLGKALLQAMNGKDATYRNSELFSLIESDACKAMLNMKGSVHALAKRNQIYDQFARNLEMSPIKGITPKQIENLLDVCIESHKKLSNIMEARKNPEMLKAANNKQPEKQMEKQSEKQMEKEAPKMKANGPKMG